MENLKKRKFDQINNQDYNSMDTYDVIDNSLIYKHSVDITNNSSANSTAGIILKYACKITDINHYSLPSGGITYDQPDDKYDIDYDLPYGDTKIKYKDHDILIEYTRNANKPQCAPHVCIIYPCKLIIRSNDEDIIKQFIVDAYEDNKPKKKESISCRTYSRGMWSYLTHIPLRDKESVFLSKDDKSKVFTDINKFISKKELYHKYGIPYKRNYLFEGIPGTGKTTMIMSIASELNMDIAIINFDHDMTDNVFMSAVTSIPRNNILVLEDIDSLFLNRESTRENKSLITFSGLLNILDGIIRNEGLITFMTTNYVRKLDAAMVRAGRVDYRINFTYAQNDQIERMFYYFYPDKEEIFKKFLKKIKKVQTTTSILQKFFFEKLDEDNLLDHIPEFIELSKEHNKDESYKNLYN